MFDGDNAGKSAAKKTAVSLEKLGIDCNAVLMKAGEDPADVLEKESAQELKNKVNSSINIIEYLIEWLVSQKDSETPEGKEFVPRELFPYIDLMTSEVKREAALGIIADRLGVNQRSVLQDYTRRQRQTSSGEDSEVIAKNQRKTDDMFLMLAVTANREHFAYVRSVIKPEDLEDEAAKEVFIALEECFRREETSTDTLLSRISNQNLKEEIIRRITSGEFRENIDRAIKESVQKIKMKSLLKKREYIERALRSKNLYESPEGDHKLRTLLEDKMYLDKELEKLRVSHDNRIAD
jgi:DNA primase